MSELATLKKDNIQWQERRLVIYGKGGPYGKKTKRRILPMKDRIRRLIEYHFAEHNGTGMTVRTVKGLLSTWRTRPGSPNLSRPMC